MAAIGHFLSTSITKLELLSHGHVIGTATGFFLKWRSLWFLVTSWHVLAGRENRSGQPRHESGALPQECAFYVARFAEDKLGWSRVIAKLHDDQGVYLNWLQHPEYGHEVDVAVLPLGSSDLGLAKNILDPGGHDPNMFIDLGHEVFLPGYPLGIAASGNMAIWKRASVASSLEFGEGIEKYFYVDTASREGMSGAPCIAMSNWRHYSLDRGTGKMQIVERPISCRLLGVYSGRRNPSDGFEAQIGIVWRETLVFDTIERGVPGSYSIT